MDEAHASDPVAHDLAREMWAECRAEGQSARVVAEDARADEVRALLRAMAHGGHVRIRTARMDDTVVVAAVDAAIWNDDAATMRRKLTPPERREEGDAALS